ncbi:hypothetical protein HER10_EVM0009493 [Colletotrichum scovillei]|nr:uncharacterized protein HER10_EVM0009493 [Colletotrichum scovillei]KAF4783393.1 hypothetical protein HER10_EVM0009493 [Colletotrichum scovillei]KAH8421852.1 Pfs [Colletotrichum scovillei]KAH8422094.1 Pfs [Colletotrichum scovillei]KAH8422118.1 Pfs [Colletotrichum scovillei]
MYDSNTEASGDDNEETATDSKTGSLKRGRGPAHDFDADKFQPRKQRNSGDDQLQRNTPVAPEDYTIGWVCAVPVEMAAARLMLDQVHPDFSHQNPADHNSYILGRVQRHNVVIACLPAGIYGLTPAATVVKDMLRTFNSIRFGLIVGIGGGAPSRAHDIRLGDIVVSQPTGTIGGIVQYDRGKLTNEGGFQRTGALNAPPQFLLAALNRLKIDHLSQDSRIPDFLSELVNKAPRKVEKRFSYQGSANDCLYEAEYEHVDQESGCGKCDPLHTIQRDPRDDTDPIIHYGNIASGFQAIKHGKTRDIMAKNLDVLCFEMGAAGLQDFPCLVIRGICDYADSHKNKMWQEYASATAAAFAKEFLSIIPPDRVLQEKPVPPLISDIHLQELLHSTQAAILAQIQKREGEHESQKQVDCHRAFKTSTYEKFKNINTDRVTGTWEWVLEHPRYTKWKQSRQDDLLWILGGPGCGKSVLSNALIDEELQNWNQHTVCYFFFKDNDNQNNLATALCALLHQLFNSQPILLRHAMYAFEKNGKELQTNVDELWRIFAAAGTDDEAVSVTCVLDALDECCTDDRRKLIQFLTTFHNQRITSTRYQLKFIVASRPHQDIETEFRGMLGPRAIRLTGEESNADISEEIKFVIRHKVASAGRRLGMSQQVQDKLQKKLFSVSHRTYRWLHFVMEEILDGQARPKMPFLKTTNTLPEKMGAYDSIFSRFDSKQQRDAQAFVRELESESFWPELLRENRLQLAPSDAQTIITESYRPSNKASETFSGGLVSTKPSSLEEDTNNVDEDNAAKQTAKTFYNHAQVESYSDGVDEEIRSLISGPEDIHSQDGSNSARWEVRTAAASYLAELLTDDATLRPLYEEASKRLDNDRFCRNHGRLLKRYYLSLLSQATNRKQIVAVNFLRPRSNRTLISRKVLESTGRERVQVALSQHEERNLTLQRFLQSEEVRQDATNAGVEPPLDIDERSEQESSVDEDEQEADQDGPYLVDLENARHHFASGASLMQFKAEFSDFLHPPSRVVQETQSPMQSQTEAEIEQRPNSRSRGWYGSVAYGKIKLSSWLYDMYCPPKLGYQRLRYICECNDPMFLDIKELKPGGIQLFRQRFMKDGLARLMAPYDPTARGPDSTAVQGPRSSLSPPPPAHLRPERSQSSSSRQSSERGTFSSRPGSPTPASDTSRSDEVAFHQEEQNTPQYLLLCVNQKSLPILDHVDCSSFGNDQYLFQHILQRYQTLREGSTWRISLLFPPLACAILNKGLASLRQNTPSWLDRMFQFFQKLSEASLFNMHTGDYVQFRLVPMGESTNPQHFKCGEYPPVSEVLEAKSYSYNPVPTDVAVDSIPLWHLTLPGRRHSDNYWITTFPKKLRGPLHRLPGTHERVIGWGIRVNERFNWHLFFSLLLVITVIIWAIVAIYLACKADDSSGFGLGAFLAALVAIYMPFQYFAWKEKLE